MVTQSHRPHSDRAALLMAFVLDCSVTMAWIFRDEATEATDRLRGALLDTRYPDCERAQNARIGPG